MYFVGLHLQHGLYLFYLLLISAEVCVAFKAGNKFDEADEDLIAKIDATA